MSTKTDLNEFKNKFCTTLQKDENGNYFKVYTDNYCSLSLYNYYLSKAIGYISQYMEFENLEDPKECGEIAFTINHLTKIIEATTLYGESEGIDYLRKE